MYEIIKRPLMTEKNSAMSADNTYVFEVDKSATKVQVRKAVEKAFRVKVTDVRTSVCRNRSRRTGLQTIGKVRYWKKAMVKLREGDKITIFEGV